MYNITEQEADKDLDEELRLELESLLQNSSTKDYFKSGQARTRHEVWFLASALSNILLISEMKKTRKILRKLLEKK